MGISVRFVGGPIDGQVEVLQSAPPEYRVVKPVERFVAVPDSCDLTSPVRVETLIYKRCRPQYVNDLTVQFVYVEQSIYEQEFERLNSIRNRKK